MHRHRSSTGLDDLGRQSTGSSSPKMGSPVNSRQTSPRGMKSSMSVENLRAQAAASANTRYRSGMRPHGTPDMEQLKSVKRGVSLVDVRKSRLADDQGSSSASPTLPSLKASPSPPAFRHGPRAKDSSRVPLRGLTSSKSSHSLRSPVATMSKDKDSFASPVPSPIPQSRSGPWWTRELVERCDSSQVDHDVRKSGHKIPPSKVPDKDHIVLEDPKRPYYEGIGTEFDRSKNVFVTKVFPSKHPSTIRETLLLEHWLASALERAISSDEKTAELLRANILSIAFSETIRQVMTHSDAQGKLLQKLWKLRQGLAYQSLSRIQKESEKLQESVIAEKALLQKERGSKDVQILDAQIEALIEKCRESEARETHANRKLDAAKTYIESLENENDALKTHLHEIKRNAEESGSSMAAREYKLNEALAMISKRVDHIRKSLLDDYVPLGRPETTLTGRLNEIHRMLDETDQWTSDYAAEQGAVDKANRRNELREKWKALERSALVHSSTQTGHAEQTLRHLGVDMSGGSQTTGRTLQDIIQIPDTFIELLDTPTNVLSNRDISIDKLVHEIRNIMTNKVQVDLAAVQKKILPKSLFETTYDMHLHRYGDPHVAANAVMALMAALQAHRDGHALIEHFCLAVGVPASEKVLPRPVMSCWFALHDKFSSDNDAKVTFDEESAKAYIDTRYASKFVRAIKGGFVDPDSCEDLLLLLEETEKLGSSPGMSDYDSFMWKLVCMIADEEARSLATLRETVEELKAVPTWDIFRSMVIKAFPLYNEYVLFAHYKSILRQFGSQSSLGTWEYFWSLLCDRVHDEASIVSYIHNESCSVPFMSTASYLASVYADSSPLEDPGQLLWVWKSTSDRLDTRLAQAATTRSQEDLKTLRGLRQQILMTLEDLEALTENVDARSVGSFAWPKYRDYARALERPEVLAEMKSHVGVDEKE